LELKQLIGELKTLSNIKLALCLSVDSTTPDLRSNDSERETTSTNTNTATPTNQLPDLTNLLELIFAHKGLINFVFIERKRTPSFIISQLIKLTEIYKAGKLDDLPSPFDSVENSLDPCGLLDALCRGSKGRITKSGK
jgi:hypothetical protein